MKKRVKKVLRGAFLLAVLALFGCAHTVSTDVEELQSQLKQRDQEIETLEASNKQKERTIEQYEVKLDQYSRAASDAESRYQMAKETSETSASSTAPLLPPQATPGECYARVFIPPTYKTTTEQLLKRGDSERVEVIPAKYEWIEERILVKAASERLEVIPAKYDWVEEKVLVKQASSRMEEVPAKYDWVEEQLLVKPAHTTWKKGRGLIEKVDNTTGEIMCLVEVPASYKTVKKKVMVTPPSTRKVEIPAEYKTVKKRVMVKAPTTRKIEIPAEYKMVKVRKLVTPPQERRIAIPAEYQTVTKTEQVADGRLEWRRVLCETNTTPDVITKVQRALLQAGHSPGPIDGILGRQTNAALKSYQKEKGLPTGGLTYSTIKSLGIKAGL